MNTPTTLDDEIINKLYEANEYELNRNKTKYEKQLKDYELSLGKLELEERELKSNAFDLLDNPEALEVAKEKIKTKSSEIEQTRSSKAATKTILNTIEKILSEVVSKKNHEQILKYLKSQGITTLEQVKAALSKNH